MRAVAAAAARRCRASRPAARDAPRARRARAFASEPHNDDWEANFEDLMAMEDSYGSGVEDLSSAAAELANARMAEQKKLRRRCAACEASSPATESRCACGSARRTRRWSRGSTTRRPFGGAGLGHAPASAGGERRRRRRSSARPGLRRDEDDVATPAKKELIDATARPRRRDAASEGDAGARAWKMGVELGYVVCVRGERVGVKRNGHPEDTRGATRRTRRTWVEVLDVGEMWEMKTGPRNLGAFASDEDYAQAQAAWAEATGEASHFALRRAKPKPKPKTS